MTTMTECDCCLSTAYSHVLDFPSARQIVRFGCLSTAYSHVLD